MNYNKVTISGRICTGKTTLFWALQKKLGWPTFSASQFFRDFARTHDVSLQKAEEQNSNLTKDVDMGMKKLLEQKENVILEGWMAGIMADEMPEVLRILLTCDNNQRIKRFSERDRVSGVEAKKKILEREESWVEKLTHIYKRNDFFEPNNYNLVIDTTHTSLEETLDLVLQALGYYTVNGQSAVHS